MTKRGRPKVIDPDNPYDLNEKQLLFVESYLVNFNETQAYMNVYKVKYDSARKSGSRLLTNVDIKKEIKRRQKKVRENAYIKADNAFNLIVKIAFSNINDYVTWGILEERNIVKAIDSDYIDGQLIQEVSQGKDGFKIKFIDKKWALDWLIQNYGLFPDKWKRSIEERKLNIMEGIKNKLGDKDIYTREELEKASNEMLEEFKDDIN